MSGFDLKSILILVLGVFVVFGVVKGLFKLVGFVLLIGVLIYLIDILI